MGREVRRASRKEVAESSKARARMKVKAKRERRPNWLPNGWIMEVGAGENGKTVKYYKSSVSGCTFRSRQEVLHHLKLPKVDGHASETTSFSENKEIVVAEVRNSLEWLPRGWILEIKTRLSGNSAGTKYKCYFDPFSGSRFYSKAEVLRFLKSGNTYSPTSGEKRRYKSSTTDNVLAQIEYSPDGLPHGWIKEILFRKSNNRVAPKRDPYYTDPVTGYMFRSLKDATRFVKTGELSKYAFGPRKRSINEMYSLEKESPPPIPARDLKSLGSTIRQNLFSEEASSSKGDGVIKINESPDKLQLSPPHHALSESFREADPTSSLDVEHMEGKFNKKRRQVVEATTDKSLNAPNPGGKRPKRGRSAVKAHTPNMESADMIAIDESPDKLQLPPPGHESSEGLHKVDSISSPDIECIEGKADKRRIGLEAAAADSLDNSKHVEKKAERRQPPKRSGPNKEKKESEELLEPKMVIEKPSETTTKITPVPQGRKQRRSKGKSASLPRRSSERLAGLEPASATDLVIRRPSFQPLSSNGGCSGFDAVVPAAEPERTDNAEKIPLSNIRCNGIEESAPLTEPGRTDRAEAKHPLGQSMLAEPEKMEQLRLAEPEKMEQLRLGEPSAEPEMMGSTEEASLREPLANPERLGHEGEASLGEQVVLRGQTSEDGPSSPLALPFGDVWSDPCIEFAVKTLMGEIPVLDEGIAIEEYVQKQLSSAEMSNPSASAPTTASANQGLDSAELLGPVELPKKQHLPVDDEGKSCPLEKGLPQRAKAPKVKG